MPAARPIPNINADGTACETGSTARCYGAVARGFEPDGAISLMLASPARTAPKSRHIHVRLAEDLVASPLENSGQFGLRRIRAACSFGS